MALSPTNSRASGGALPSEWTVADNGSLAIQTDDDDGYFRLRLNANPDCTVDLGVVDSGGQLSALIQAESTNGGAATISAFDTNEVAVTSVVIQGFGTVDAYTAAGSKAFTAWDATGDTLRFAILPAGQIMTGVVAAPADGDLAAGQLAFWFDATNGAAKLMVKAKQADGTVRTAAVALT